MEYRIEDKKFSFSYQELKQQYLAFSTMTDEHFFKDLPKVLHFVCFVSYVKELSTEVLLRDDGLLHELIHLLSSVETVTSKEEIREKFNTLMKLS